MRAQVLRLGALAVTAALILAACGASESMPRGPLSARQHQSQQASDQEGQREVDEQLIAAAWANDVEAARALIAQGADVNATDGSTQSAYLIATSEGYLPLLELTLGHGADITSLDSWDGTGLIRASERGHADIVGRLIQAGIDTDHVNNLGWVGLHEALVFAKADQVEAYMDAVRVLVAGDADVTIASRTDGLTPVVLAEQNGLEAQAQLLREALAAEPVSPDAADELLLAAAETGDADAAALALRAGADLEARNPLQQTPLLLASTHD